MEKKVVPGHKIWLIRHGYSEFNFYKEQRKADRTLPYDRFSRSLVDARLHTKGVEQCLAAQKNVNSKNVRYVFVSPMERAIETSYHLFAAHPNLGNIIFVVHPLLREILNNANDVPNHTLERLRVKYEKMAKYHYDFAAFDTYPVPALYYLQDLNSPEKETLLKRVEEGKGKDDVDVVLEAARADPTKKLENYRNVNKRTVDFAIWLKDFISKGEIKLGEEIAIVTHTEVIMQALAKKIGEDGKSDFPFMENCAIFPWDLQI